MAHVTKAIVVRNQNHHIPDDFKKKLLEGTTAVGCAFVDKGEIELYSENNKPTLGTIKENEDAFNFRQIMWFGSYENDFLEEDLQPFTLIIDDKKPVVVAFLEGEFIAYEHPGENHSNAYYVVNELLAEKVNKVYDDCEQDLDKTIATLDSPTFRSDLRATLHPRGVITMLFQNGEIRTFALNKDAGMFEWGSTSNKLGYEEAKIPVEPEGPKQPMSAAERLAAKRAARAQGSAPPPTETPAPTQTLTSVPSAPKTDTKIPDAAIAKTDPILFPPAELSSPKARAKWYNRNFGQKPAGWEQGKVGLPYSKLKPNSPLRTHKLGEPIPTGIASHIPPVIGPGDIKKLTEGFLPKDDKSTDLMSVEDLGSLEEEYASFFETLDDYPVHLFLRWSLKKKRELVKEYPQAAFTVMVDLCNMLIKQNPKLLEPVLEEKKEAPQPVVEKTAAEKLAEKRAARRAM